MSGRLAKDCPATDRCLGTSTIQDTLRAAGFEHLWSADLRREVDMTQADLVEYLMTHSERIAAVQLGLETEAEQRSALSEGIAPFFVDAATRRLVFGIDVDLFQLTRTARGTSSP